MRLIVINIAALVCDRCGKLRLQGREMSHIDVIEDAYLLVKDGVVSSFGKMDELSSTGIGADVTVDAHWGTYPYRVCR